MQFGLFEKIIEDAREHRDFVLVTVTDVQGSTPGQPGFRMAVYADGTIRGTIGGGNLEHTARRVAQELLSSGSGPVTKSFTMEQDLGMSCGGRIQLFFEPYSPWRLTLVGGGHVAQAVAPLAQSVGFVVEVFDDRPEIAEHPWPAGVRVHIGDMVEACRRLQPALHHCALVMTYQHLRDADTAAALVGHDLAYLGIIGSRRKAHLMLENLQRSGAAPERLQKVRTPVGVPVGAQTPAEIAVSVVAELIAVRASMPLLPWT